MQFGRTLQQSIYPPWKEEYVDYSKLQGLLREGKGEDDETQWTEDDEKRFCDELFNVQLEKVSKFQEKIANELKERADTAFEKLKEMAPSEGKPKSDITTARMKELREELDAITNEIQELKKYASVNYTGFLKIVKKHDRKRGDMYKVRPMIRLGLSNHGFNSEQTYSPLLKKLSAMYWIINQHLEQGDQTLQPPDLENKEEVQNGERYTAHKFWVHRDNLLEVKTFILRRLPSLVYSQQSSKELDGNEDPTITSLYFDNSDFDLYSKKVANQPDATSVRLRWYGQLSANPEILLEKKVVREDGESEEKRITIKEKYIKAFVKGEYKMERSVQKMERMGQSVEDIEAFKATVSDIQDFIRSNKLEPVLRANYTRTAFQKPADDRVRISIDTDIAFIREDTLDQDRPCRDPQEWHRLDIDNRNIGYPFSDINQSEVSRFPYAVLEIKLREDGNRKRSTWIEDLMGSYLVHPVSKFSKFIHGSSALFEDYVNNYPLWLVDVDKDIRKDPQIAFEEEEQRKAVQAENEQVVGSFLGTKSASFKPTKSSPLAKSYLSERVAAEAAKAANGTRAQDGAGSGQNTSQSSATQSGYGTLSSVIPTFSIKSRTQRNRVQLPEGVEEPKEWIKNAGPLQIEPKVWLANERTFLKWQHISILLGSLAVSLYSAAGKNILAEAMGIAYIIIAVLAGLWGYYMLQKRRNMILERSGKDFDNMIGPVVVSCALMVSLVLNFVFAYRDAFAKLDIPSVNGTEVFVGELL